MTDLILKMAQERYHETENNCWHFVVKYLAELGICIEESYAQADYAFLRLYHENRRIPEPKLYSVCIMTKPDGRVHAGLVIGKRSVAHLDRSGFRTDFMKDLLIHYPSIEYYDPFI